MLYYMAVLLAAALGLGAAGLIAVPPLNLAFSTLVIAATCWAVNALFARCFGAVTHTDSILITAVILVFLISPFAPWDGAGIGFGIFAAAWAAASKYVLATRGRHLFNPAAFGVALAGLALHRSVSWWVGDWAVLLPIIAAGGAIMVHRLRFYDLLASFTLTVLAITIAHGGQGGGSGGAASSVSLILIHSMFGFFAFVMLTEPRTAPIGRWRHIVLGVLVGILFSPSVHIGSYYFTPEMALLAGNLFTFFSNRRRLERWRTALAPAA
jgi:Na+-transporting NADH:ubiquinone oxidoreductase subunit NqrB